MSGVSSGEITSACVKARRRASREASKYLPAVRDIQAGHCRIYVFTAPGKYIEATAKPILIFEEQLCVINSSQVVHCKDDICCVSAPAACIVRRPYCIPERYKHIYI